MPKRLIFSPLTLSIMDDSDFGSSRSPKRRRISESAQTNSCYSSPDELAASSDHELSYIKRRNSSIRKDQTEYRKHSYHDDVSDESPDELDHTVHTFYRDSRGRSLRALDMTSTGEQSAITARSRISSEESRSRPYMNYKEKLVLKGHRMGVAAVKFSPDGRCIASCCQFF